MRILYFLTLLSLLILVGCGGSTSSDNVTTSDNTTAIVSNAEYRIVATGQTECYDTDGNVIDCPQAGESLYGQDAQFIKNEFSFNDLGNGLVQDLNTGLIWQQSPTSQTFTWENVVNYCNSLTLGGYDDWRVPSAKELFSLSNFSEGWPYIDTKYFELASGNITKDEQYWTSNYYVGTTVEGGEDAAFGVNFVTGHIKAYSAKATGPIGEKYVRCVRGNAYGNNNFIDNLDGTITDNATSLMWSQTDFGPFDWEEALQFAYDSNYAGYTDWRLPAL
ncbi:DUF1566 domain-containing protein [Deferribacteraceae bacterium V6Fe1]|nr:DUF1566 domain-containing protein [Deferribacteraceae bacterium V6Fe1]